MGKVLAKMLMYLKGFDFEIKDKTIEIKIDPNQDGEPVFEGKVHLKEVPDEIFSVFKG